jgi:hypothetical protein
MDKKRSDELTQLHEELVRLREEFAQLLRQQREALLREVTEGLAELRPMEGERASELEERAQIARDTRLLARMDDQGAFRNHMIMPGGRIRHSVYFSITHDEWPRGKAYLEELLSSYPASSTAIPSSGGLPLP